MKKGIIYARHLGTRDYEKSVEEQVEECKKYALENDIEVVDCYSDYLFSKKINPNSFDLLSQKLKKLDVDYVIVYNTCILGRDTTKIRKFINKIYENNKQFVDTTSKDTIIGNLQNLVRQCVINTEIR